MQGQGSQGLCCMVGVTNILLSSVGQCSSDSESDKGYPAFEFAATSYLQEFMDWKVKNWLVAGQK